jgi:hypothetical protein
MSKSMNNTVLKASVLNTWDNHLITKQAVPNFRKQNLVRLPYKVVITM